MISCRSSLSFGSHNFSSKIPKSNPQFQVEKSLISSNSFSHLTHQHFSHNSPAPPPPAVSCLHPHAALSLSLYRDGTPPSSPRTVSSGRRSGRAAVTRKLSPLWSEPTPANCPTKPCRHRFSLRDAAAQDQIFARPPARNLRAESSSPSSAVCASRSPPPPRLSGVHSPEPLPRSLRRVVARLLRPKLNFREPVGGGELKPALLPFCEASSHLSKGN
ncbi:hypothetical protein AAHA92_31510 [Salvia divinorum]|uniref:Uncharacterized protein n=1 Tax=Salvia divinorum TaxID=28513 RepID=A0ABD1FT42_SALDI